MPKQNKEIATRKESLPAFLDWEPVIGLENATPEDYVIPRVQIAQALSPELNNQQPKYISGLRQGDTFNTVTRENYGRAIKVVPLWFFKSRILFRPREEGGGILCQSRNGVNGGTISPTCAECPNSKWGSGRNGDGIACNEFKNYPALVLRGEEPDLVSVSMKSSQIKVSKAWNTLIRMRRKSTFAGIYELKTVEEKNPKGTFYNFLINNAGWVTEHLYKIAKETYDVLNARGVSIDTSDMAGETKEDGPDFINKDY